MTSILSSTTPLDIINGSMDWLIEQMKSSATTQDIAISYSGGENSKAALILMLYVCNKLHLDLPMIFFNKQLCVNTDLHEHVEKWLEKLKTKYEIKYKVFDCDQLSMMKDLYAIGTRYIVMGNRALSMTCAAVNQIDTIIEGKIEDTIDETMYSINPVYLWQQDSIDVFLKIYQLEDVETLN